MFSYWEKSTLLGSIDVAIIGSGIVGLNAACEIKRKHPNLKVVVIERGALPWGASTKNAGFACFGSVSELLDDLKSSDWDTITALVKKRWDGLKRLRNKLGDNNIGFSQTGGHEVFRPIIDDGLANECLNKIDHINRQLAPIFNNEEVFQQRDELIESNGLKGVNHLIFTNFEGQIDTGKMMRQLISLTKELGVDIINGLEVIDFEESNETVVLDTIHGSINTKYLLVASNGFAKNLIDLPVKPARAQVLITNPIQGLKLRGTFHLDRGYYYFRNVENRILLGGARNIAEKEEETDQIELNRFIQDHLKQFLHDHIDPANHVSIDMQWSGIMGVGGQKPPIVKQLSERTVCAVRLGGMGIAIGTHTGEQAATKLSEII